MSSDGDDMSEAEEVTGEVEGSSQHHDSGDDRSEQSDTGHHSEDPHNDYDHDHDDQSNDRLDADDDDGSQAPTDEEDEDDEDGDEDDDDVDPSESNFGHSTNVSDSGHADDDGAKSTPKGKTLLDPQGKVAASSRNPSTPADAAGNSPKTPQSGKAPAKATANKSASASANASAAAADASGEPKRKKRKGMPAGLGGSRKGRAPAVRGLTIPFRTVKKAMKLDPDIPIVQNEAAIMTTLASELFLKALAKNSYDNAKARGRNTIRYEDVAEARTKKPSLSFLETLLP